jgi:transcriptional regulator with GAF, ATPase, and Fis domain
LDVPPLRTRSEDILPLARELLRTAALKLNTPVPTLSPDDERALLAYDFPGNIRELQNVIERAVVLHQSEGGLLDLQLARRRAHKSVPPRAARETHDAREPVASTPVMAAADLRELERKNILAALEQCAWRVAGEHGAAKLLGMPASTLTYQMKTLGIERE